MSEIERMIEKGFDLNRLAAAAHEIGHGHYFTRHVIKVDYVTLGATMTCKRELSGNQRKHYLIAGAAGAAAQCRFLQKYCGYSKSEGKSFSYGGSKRDRQIFSRKCDEFGIGMSFDSAFSTAYSWAGWHGGRLDSLTVKLAKSGRLSGSAVG